MKSNGTGTDADRPPAAPRRAHGRRLSLLDRHSIIQLRQRHPALSYRELARLSGASVETVQRVVLTSERETAELMSAFAEPVVRQWWTAIRHAAKRGDARPAERWLLYAGRLDPLPESVRGTGMTINILNAPLPGTVPELPAALPADGRDAPTIDVVDSHAGVKSPLGPPDDGS